MYKSLISKKNQVQSVKVGLRLFSLNIKVFRYEH